MISKSGISQAWSWAGPLGFTVTLPLHQTARRLEALEKADKKDRLDGLHESIRLPGCD